MKSRQISDFALAVLALSTGLGALSCGTDRMREPGTGERFSCTSGDIDCDAPVVVQDLKAELAIDPPNVDFGNVQVGTEIVQVVLLRNTGDALLVLESASRGPTFDDAFSFDLNRMTIPPRGVAQLEITFGPNSLGEKLASIVVRSNDINVPDAEIKLTGTGVTTNLAISSEVVSFGNVVINTTKTISVSLTNNSDIDANILLIEGQNVRRCTSGTNDPSVFCLLLTDRTISSDGRFALRAGESTTLDVQFSPVIAGTRERGNFTLRACENSACETLVRLDGLGIEQGFRCDPSYLEFGQVNIGSCLAKTVSCENIANERITVRGWGPSSGAGQNTSPDYTLEPSAVMVLHEGDAFGIDVTYCPDAPGSDEGNLQIETDQPVPNQFALVRLAGTGG